MKEIVSNGRLITTDRILDGLRVDIVAGRYRQGDKIVEEEISRQYNVSRGSVRAAIMELESEGLIRVLPNGRKEVVEFSTKQAQDIYDLRWLLENRAMEIALETESMNLVPMLDVLHQIEACENASAEKNDWFMLDIQFHQALVMAANNNPLLVAWKTNISVMHTLMKLNMVQSFEEYRKGFYQQHKEIFGYIVAHSKEVFPLLREHIMSARP